MECKRSIARGCAWTLAAILGLTTPRLGAQNLVPNPVFDGTGGVNLGVTVLSEGVPDQWRAFAVGGGAAEMEVVPVAEDEIFPGSPATNAVLFRVTAFGADQGFDDDNGRFPVAPGLEHHGEFYVRSGNDDGTDQQFNFGFPLFNSAHVYQGIEPGGMGGQTAGAEWQLYTGPTFTPPGTVAEGHISFRCIGDGGEDSILIALPSVTKVGTLEFPTSLVCRRNGFDVELGWADPGPYDSLRVMRDGAEIAALDVAASTYTDPGVPDGAHTYQVLATVAGTEDGPSCDVSIFRVPVGTKVSVDLGDEDVSTGLENNGRGDGGDGENEFVVCGPEGDLREARSNYGGEDPTVDFPDGLFYFNVTDLPMKAQSTYRLEVTVYDDPARAGTGLLLQYTNGDSTGPGDIPNTFFPLAAPPVRTFGGTGEWVVLTWDLENAGFRSFQQGLADFRIGVTDAGRVCVDRVDLTFFPVPTSLVCRRSAEGVALAWVNNGAYDQIAVFRNGGKIATLPGAASSFEDADAPDGDNTYQVVATVGGLEGGPSCAITVFNVPPGTRVSVDLGEEDISTGLENNVRGDGGDGENEFAVCGPEGDLREGRSNYGAEDPTPEFPDPLFYFNVTDPAMKAQAAFRLEVTVYDDPGRAGAVIYLQYTNSSSTGPGDIPNTFFPLGAPPTNVLAGSGEWVTLTWDIADAGFRSFQQGAADFRLGTTDAGRICIDKVELVFGDTDGEVLFHRGDADDNGDLQLTDAVRVLGFLFLGSPPPPCLEAADADDNGSLQLTDAVRILGFLFLGGPPPEPPGPPGGACGSDPEGSPDLGCDSYTSC